MVVFDDQRCVRTFFSAKLSTKITSRRNNANYKCDDDDNGSGNARHCDDEWDGDVAEARNASSALSDNATVRFHESIAIIDSINDAVRSGEGREQGDNGKNGPKFGHGGPAGWV